MRATRSLHINTERTWRGGEKQTLSLVTGLVDCGHVAELACPPGSPLADRARKRGIAVHPVSMRGEADLIAVARLRRILRRGEFDVCQMHTSHAHALGVMARGWQRHPVTIVNRRVDFSILRKGLFGLNKIKYRYGVDRYIAISHAIREVLIRDGIDGGNIEVVHSGVTPYAEPTVDRRELRARHGVTDDQVLIGNVAHLADHKGQRFLVQAMGELRTRYPRARLIILGEGEERPRIEAEIQRFDLADVVTLAGFQTDISSYLRALDVFVMPSIMEGLCTSILDALLASLPVIGSDTGGIPEIIRDGETGLLARPGDPSHLADRIATLLDDPEGARSLARRGKKHVEDEFSVENMVQGTLDVYRRILS